MIDLKLIRNNIDYVKKKLEKRKDFDFDILDQIKDLDKNWRDLKKKLDDLKALKNSENEKINLIKKSGGNIEEQVKKVKEITKKIEDLESKVKDFYSLLEQKLKQVPNLLDDEVPEGLDDEDNVTIREVGERKKFNFKVRNHIELCEKNDWFDLETASKVAGSRFYYLKNELVLLEFALVNYVLNKFYKKSYTCLDVPPMLRREIIDKSISLEDFEDVIYKIEKEDLYLIGTAEHSIAPLFLNKILKYNELPKKFIAFSPSFRKEAGVTKDSKGIFRVHNFNKIEQFIFSNQEDSPKFLEELINNAEEIFKELEIPYRVVDICSGDIGNFASRKYDLEAWLPSQEKYREMVSASNYREYSARRLNTRYQTKNNEIKFVHTLNSTAIALTRTIIAIIENHQTEDGNVKLPKVLQEIMGREYLK